MDDLSLLPASVMQKRKNPRSLTLRYMFLFVQLAITLLLQGSVRSLFCKAESIDLYSDDESKYIVHLKTASEILESDQIWMVQLYRPDQSESKEVAGLYKALSKLVRGVFPVSVIDVTDNNDDIIKQLSLSTTVKVPAVYVIGDDKKNPIKVGERGKSFPDIKMLAEALMEQASKVISLRSQNLGSSFTGSSNRKTSSDTKKGDGKSHVVQLNGSNFDQYVYQNPDVVAVAFTAPWCGHCKNLLPEWEEAAAKLAGTGAILGWIDATAETSLAQQNGVKGYPTIKIFPGGMNKDPSKAEDYKYERTSRTIVQYMLQMVDQTGVVPPTPELVNATVLESTCSGHNRICVLVALPHIVDSGADGRNKYIERIDAIAKKFRGTAFTFLWYEYTSQPLLEQSLELTFGAPALVALSDRKSVV